METTINNEQYMRRCIELARLGFGATVPNPMVGAVIVHQGKIIGEVIIANMEERMQRLMPLIR